MCSSLLSKCFGHVCIKSSAFFILHHILRRVDLLYLCFCALPWNLSRCLQVEFTSKAVALLPSVLEPTTENRPPPPPPPHTHPYPIFPLLSFPHHVCFLSYPWATPLRRLTAVVPNEITSSCVSAPTDTREYIVGLLFW